MERRTIIVKYLTYSKSYTKCSCRNGFKINNYIQYANYTYLKPKYHYTLGCHALQWYSTGDNDYR